MSRTPTAPTKNRYESMIHTYLKRREKLRQQYKPRDKSGEYGRRSRALTIKLNNWRRRVQILEKRRNGLIHIANQLYEFYGFQVRDSVKDRRPFACTGRNIFYKYCIEHGYAGSYASYFVGAKSYKAASDQRRVFTRSFSKYPERKELYQSFIAHMRNNDSEQFND